jgi:hypothetical protein
MGEFMRHYVFLEFTDFFIPDPIPYADEILMTLGTIRGIKRKLLDE